MNDQIDPKMDLIMASHIPLSLKDLNKAFTPMMAA